MENKDLNDLLNPDNVVETPKNEYLMATVTDVTVTTKADAFDLEEGEQPRYGNREDLRLMISAVVTYNGVQYDVDDSMNVPEDITDRHRIGRFLNTYKKRPEEGMDVAVYFDGQGRDEILVDDEDVAKVK